MLENGRQHLEEKSVSPIFGVRTTESQLLRISCLICIAHVFSSHMAESGRETWGAGTPNPLPWDLQPTSLPKQIITPLC